jgi:anti-anti-sigma factor
VGDEPVLSALALQLAQTRERSQVVARDSVVACQAAAQARLGSRVACSRSSALRRHGAEGSRFVLRGEIDVANADRLLTTLRRVASEQTGEVVVDCTELTFIDAGGIRALVLVHHALAEHGRELRLEHPPPLLTRMLQALDLLYLLAPIAMAPAAS